MKNQYFGDVNDYRKYGLLRALQGGGLSLAVWWMLTPNDGGSDGGFRRYVERPEDWRRFDPELYDWMASALREPSQPHVGLIEESGLLADARFVQDIVPDDASGRARAGAAVERTVAGADLVFLDPDNGLEIASKQVGQRGSSKYATWSEVESLWAAGSSLLIYQHFRRESRDEFAQRTMAEFASHTGAPLVASFRTPHVLFLLAGQGRHAVALEVGISRVMSEWHGQIEPVAFSR
jgi:hypothetical protein